MDVTLEMSALAFLEQAEVKELVRPSQQSWLDSSRPTLITCSRVRPIAVRGCYTLPVQISIL